MVTTHFRFDSPQAKFLGLLLFTMALTSLLPPAESKLQYKEEKVEIKQPSNGYDATELHLHVQCCTSEDRNSLTAAEVEVSKRENRKNITK